MSLICFSRPTLHTSKCPENSPQKCIQKMCASHRTGRRQFNGSASCCAFFVQYDTTAVEDDANGIPLRAAMLFAAGDSYVGIREKICSWLYLCSPEDDTHYAPSSCDTVTVKNVANVIPMVGRRATVSVPDGSHCLPSFCFSVVHLRARRQGARRHC